MTAKPTETHHARKPAPRRGHVVKAPDAYCPDIIAVNAPANSQDLKILARSYC